MYITGYKEEAAKLLDKFVWGHSFIELNKNLLEEYSNASSSDEVIKIQEKYIADAEADVEARKQEKKKMTIDELIEMGNPNYAPEEENEEEEEEEEDDDDDDDDDDKEEEEEEEEEEDKKEETDEINKEDDDNDDDDDDDD